MGLKKLIFFVCLILIGLTLIQAAPPTQSTTIIEKGLQIEVPMFESIKVNNTFKFHAHVHNATDGKLVNNITTWCIIHLYRPSNGGHVYESNMSFDSNLVDFDKTLSANNFTEIGQYAVLIYCETEGEVAGFIEFPFEVTPSGLILKESEALIYFVVLLMLLALFCFSLYGSIFIPFKNQVSEDDASVINVNTLKYLKVFLIVLSYIFLFFMTSIIYSISSGFLMIDKLSFVFYYLWILLYAGIWPCIILSVLLLLIKFLQDKKISNALERGVPFR